MVDSVLSDVQLQKMQQRNNILKKVKNYINNELNPSKKTFLERTIKHYEELKSIDEILGSLEISKHDYEALSMYDDNDIQIHYKRPPNSYFVNNYFCGVLMVWEANMDIKPVFNLIKQLHTCAYLSISENECSVPLKQSVRDGFEKELNNYEQMKSVANTYINKREWSIQQCVCHILPDQWLRKTFPVVVFANSNIPEKHVRLCLVEHEISKLLEDSKKIFKSNMVDQNIDRPDLFAEIFLFFMHFVLQNFTDTIMYHAIQNIGKMITNRRNLMMK